MINDSTNMNKFDKENMFNDKHLKETSVHIANFLPENSEYWLSVKDKDIMLQAVKNTVSKDHFLYKELVDKAETEEMNYFFNHLETINDFKRLKKTSEYFKNLIISRSN